MNMWYRPVQMLKSTNIEGWSAVCYHLVLIVELISFTVVILCDFLCQFEDRLTRLHSLSISINDAM